MKTKLKKDQQLIQDVFLQLSQSKEAQYYLKHYKVSNQEKFVVIKIGGNIVAKQLAELTHSISLIHLLGLTPILLHGAGPQIDSEFEEQNLSASKLDGIRVTKEDDINLIEEVVSKVHLQLIESLESQNVETTSIFNDVFSCDLLDEDKYGLVGNINHVHLHKIKQAVESKKVPVLSCLGKDEDGRVVNINADIAIKKLVWAIKPIKVIFVTPTGGLLDKEDQLISALQLNNSYENLMQQEWLHSGMKLKIQQIYQLLKPMPRKLSVSITSASNLTKELFTHKGNGTYVTMGVPIQHFTQFPSAAKLTIISLLESTFKKKLKVNFLEEIKLLSVFLSESGQAIAIVTEGHKGKPYLNKFAVTTQAQGQGQGKLIWDKMLEYYPELYWRSRSDNAINDWYFKKSLTSFKKDNWVTYSCGMNLTDSMECMNEAVNYSDSWQEQSA
jgi:acetylglutamate kinase